jgi:hypothetical protein
LGIKRGVLAGQPVAQHQRQPRAQKGERQAADHLIRLEADGDDAVGQAEDARGQHRQQQPQPRVSRGQRHAETGHGADQHHAFDAQVQDARPLGQQFADAGKEQHGAGGQTGVQDDFQIHAASPAAFWSARVRTSRTL